MAVAQQGAPVAHTQDTVVAEAHATGCHDSYEDDQWPVDPGCGCTRRDKRCGCHDAPELPAEDTA